MEIIHMESKKDKKAEYELRKKMKEMENKQFQEILSTQPEEVSSEPKVISFDEWWMIINSKVPQKEWLKEIIWADFKARGRGKKETEEYYNEALRLFGIKI